MVSILRSIRFEQRDPAVAPLTEYADGDACTAGRIS
jgi:hypothetical protein